MTSSVSPGGPGVLFVANFGSEVGYAWTFIEGLWKAFARHPALAGHRFHVAYPVVQGDVSRWDDLGWTVHERAVPGDPKTLGRFLRDHDIRVIYFTDRPFTGPTYVRCKLHGVSTIIVHDHSPGLRSEPGPMRGLVKAAAARLPLWSCDAAFGVGAFIADRIVRVSRMPRDRVFRVTNGIEPGPPPPERDGRDFVRVVTVGRADRYKGIDFALDVMRELVHERGRTDVRYVLYGGGPDLEAFRARAAELALGDAVELPGRVSDVRARLERADIAFHPSRGEALSLAILEYMQTGLPVVVSDNPSVNSPLTDGVDAVFYREGDVDAAADAIARLADDRALRVEMGTSARAAQESRFSRASMHSELNDALTTLFG